MAKHMDSVVRGQIQFWIESRKSVAWIARSIGKPPSTIWGTKWGQAPWGERDFYAFETQGGTAGHVGGALCHRHRVHCCMFRYWESLT